MEILMKPIGYIQSPYEEKADVPRQSALAPGSVAAIKILKEYEEGIADIKEGEYGVVLFYFHRSEGYQLTTPARGSGKMMGVFSTRSPNRPNGIGMSVVRFMKKEGCLLTFEGVDMLNDTPVLDIKPYSRDLFPQDQ